MNGGQGQRWDVFVAYASADRDRARTLHQALVQAGLSVCFDQAVLRPGDNWHRVLPAHLRASAVVVVLVSAHTAEATYAEAEVVLALGQVRREGARLVPLRLHPDAQLPYGTEALHALDYFDPERTAAVVDALVDVVRHPSTAPAVGGSQVWSARVPALPPVVVGLEGVLERLWVQLWAEAGAGVTQTIHGMGGVGKTTLAAALAEAHRHELDVVWWVRAEQASVLVADMADLAPRVGVVVDDDPATTATSVREWLETTPRRWLVVFDNAPDDASVAPWRPRRGNGASLVTSRNRNMDRLGPELAVDVLDDDAAADFLRRRVAGSNLAAAAEDLSGVLRRLGGLPLALEQAAAWVERVPNRRFARYAELYDDAVADPFPDATRPLGYEHTAASAWRVSVDAASTEAPGAGRVLTVLGFLGPDELPCEWLRERAGAGDTYLDATPAQVDDALAALHGYSLVEVDSADMLTVHRVVQASARRGAPPEAAGCAIALLRAQTDGEPEDPARWPVRAALVPHALAAVATTGPALPEEAPDLRWVLNDLCRFQRSRGATSAAIDAGMLAVDIAGAHLGTDHPDTLASCDNLALAYQDAGNLARAVALFETTLADRQRVLGPDHPETLASGNNLARAYQDTGNLGRAIPLFEATVAACERVLGPDHPYTLTTRNNLAVAYQDAGNLAHAVALFEATLADRRRVLGPDHPDTLTTRNNLAYAYNDAGDLGRAIPLFEAIVADSERVLGPEHPDVVVRRNNLALAYKNSGDLGRAVPLFEVTLADSERVLGPDHRYTLTSRNNLARAYQDGGDLSRAVPMFEATLAAWERVLGPEHPDTLISRNNLARAYQNAGDLARAVPMFEATLAACERVLGPDHPYTLASRNNLASVVDAVAAETPGNRPG